MNQPSELLFTAEAAFQDFSQGLATGNWQPFLGWLTEDFCFSFPVGVFKGKNIGKEKAEEFFRFVSDRIFSEGLTLTLRQITHNETTVVFEVDSTGKMMGQPYDNQAAIAFEVRGNQICSYREYLSVFYQITNQT